MAVTVTRPGRRRPSFHPLPVAAVERITDDALTVTFAVPPEVRPHFEFRAGQYLTVQLPAGVPGSERAPVRRSYSLCSPPSALTTAGLLRIAVKEIPGGEFSRFVAHRLRPGDEVAVLPPMGRFTTDFDPDRQRRYAAVVAGSGITPVLSLVAAGLEREPRSRFTILYGNRTARSVMFAEELADLKDRWPDRFALVHVWSREPGDAELLAGRIDRDRLPRLLDVFVPGPVDEWFLCGPFGLVETARDTLAARGVPSGAIHTELFHVATEPPPAPAARVAGDPTAGPALTLRLDGRTSTVTMAPGERVLDAALRVRPELPYACRGGVCSTCRARVTEGAATMARNWALEPDELAAGYVLTCQATPEGDRLTVDYDG